MTHTTRTKNERLGSWKSRLFAFTLAFLMILQPLSAAASPAAGGESPEGQALGISQGLEVEAGTEAAADSVSVVAPDRKIPLGFSDFDLTTGMKATDKETGEDAMSSVVVTDNGGFDPHTPGEYTVQYVFVGEDAFTGTASRVITVTDYTVNFTENIWALRTYPTDEEKPNIVESDPYFGMLVYDKDGNDVSEDIAVIDDGGLDHYQMGVYALEYQLVRDGEVLVEISRAITVRPKITMFALVGQTLGSTSDPLYVQMDTDGRYNSTYLGQYQFFNYWAFGTVWHVGTQKYSTNYHGSSLGTGTTAFSNSNKTYTISWVKNGMTFQHAMTLQTGAKSIYHQFRVINNTGAPISNVKVAHGGDAWFAGNDYGWSLYDELNDSVYLIASTTSNTPRPDAGIMSFKANTATPAASYYAGKYTNVNSAIQSGNFPTNPGKKGFASTLDRNNLASGERLDNGFALLWTKDSIANGQTWEVSGDLSWADFGLIQIISPGQKTVPNGVAVSYNFTLRNFGNVAKSVNLSVSSDKSGWTPTLYGPSTVTVAANGEATITVYIDIPAGATSGEVGTLTLNAQYDNSGTKTTSGSVATVVNRNLPAISDLRIVYQDNSTLKLAADYINLDGPRSTEITILNTSGAVLLGPMTQSVSSGATESVRPGELFVFNISGLAKDADYIARAKVSGIDYPSEKRFTVHSRVDSLTVTPAASTISIGGTVSLTATILPTDVPNRAVKWTSSNTAVATVDANGVVTAKTSGTVTITATSVLNPNVSGTATVTVKTNVSSITTNPTELVLKKGDSKSVNATIAPSNASNKAVSWSTASGSIATVTGTNPGDSNSNPKAASITGVNDGVTNVTVQSADNANMKATVKVSVDGTVPKADSITLTKSGSAWRSLIPTKEKMNVSVVATDPVTNGFASGVDKIYYQVIKDGTAPTFNLSNPTGWSLAAENGTFTFDKDSSGNNGDGNYKVYVVVVDKVGNYSPVTEANDSAAVDTTVPQIGLVAGASSEIHVLTGTTVNKAMLLQGVTAADNGVDITSQLTVTPASVVTTAAKQQQITYSYTDAAGNAHSMTRTVYVHEGPSITASDTVNVNEREDSLVLLPKDSADNRIALKIPSFNYFTKIATGAVNSAVGNGSVTIEGAHVTGNTLDLSSLSVGDQTRVTYTVTFDNPLLAPSTLVVTKTVNFVVYKNGQVPGGPDPKPNEKNTEDLVIPEGKENPSDGNDDRNANRVAFYQNHGVILSGGSRLPKDQVTVSKLQNTVVASGELTLSIRVQGESEWQTLDASALQRALEMVGVHELQYQFVDEKGNVAYYDVELRVNSDMRPDHKDTVHVSVDTVLSPSGYLVAAHYDTYKRQPADISINVPADINTSTVHQGTMDFSANYPYTQMPVSRTYYVHGLPYFELNSTASVNKTEGSMNLTADTRLGYHMDSVEFFNARFARTSQMPQLFINGEHITSGILDLSEIPDTSLPKVIDVTYKTSYDNPFLGTLSQEKVVKITIYANGQNPDGPNPVPNPDLGVVIPPESGTGSVIPGEPKEDSNVYRIAYYQNNGNILSNGGRKAGALTLDEVKNAVNAASATSKTVTLNGADLTASNFSNALANTGEYTLLYTFKDAKGNVAYFTVYLRVNSDILKGADNPIDTGVGVVVAPDVYSGVGNMSASYKAYSGTTVELSVIPPSGLDTAAVKSYYAGYAAVYPYADKEMQRTVRVHGNVSIKTNAIDVRVGSDSAALLSGVTGTVELAPARVGGSNSVKNLDATQISLAIGAGDLSAIGRFQQEYTGRYPLPTEYSSDYVAAGNGTRQVTVHGNPVIVAGDLTVGKNFTAAQFSDSMVGMESSVQYYGGSVIDLTGSVTRSSLSAVNFGTPGTYTITYTVKDDAVSQRPAGLPGKTVEKSIKITVVSGNAGAAPIVSGVKDISVLEGTALNDSVLLADVTAVDAKKNSSLAVEWTTDAGSMAAPGTYTVTYKAVDSLGDVTELTANLYVYGKIQLEQASYESDTRISSEATFVPSLSNVVATYVAPDKSTVTVTSISHPGAFRLGGNVDLTTVGQKNTTVTASHPVFADNKDTAAIVIRVNGTINFKGFNEVNNKIYYTDETVDTHVVTAKAFYTNYKSETVELQATVTPDRALVSSNTADVVPVTYTVVDDLLTGKHADVTVNFRFNLVPVLHYRNTAATLNMATVTVKNNQAYESKVRLVYKLQESFGMYWDRPGYVVTLTPKFDLSRVDFATSGTYPIVASINDGIRTVTADLQLTVIAETIKNGWINEGGNIYYYQNGNKTIGWANIEGYIYYFDANGQVSYGWRLLEGSVRYFNEYGRLVKGWYEIGGNVHYFDEFGRMVYGWQLLDDSVRYFNEHGYLVKGWCEINGNIHFFDIYGSMVYGWRSIDNHTYYFNEHGYLIKGSYSIGGILYTFDDWGRLVG